MFLVELVMQGVRGIRELARLRFQAGFNFVAAGNESGKTSSADTMLRLLFPGDDSRLMETLISRHAPDASRGALVVYADDTAYYRIIQDFSKRAVNLSRYNPGTKDFTLLHKDWQSTAQFMADLTGGISEQDYARLFVLRRGLLTADGPPPAAQLRQTAFTQKAVPTARDAGREAKLAELREALRKSEEASDADYRVQSAKLRLEEIGKKLEQIDDVDRRSAEIAANVDRLKPCESMPEDLAGMLEAHEERQGQKMAKSDELTKEMADVQLQLESLPQPNLVKDKLFILGVGVGFLSVIAGLFLLTTEQDFLFPLGVLVALALIAGGWYRGSIKNNERKALVREAGSLQAELDELDKSFEQGGAGIEACMKATGTKTIAELKEAVENYRYFRSLQEELEQERGRLTGGVSREELQGQYEKQQQEMGELEKQAAALSQYAVDAYSLRQDIDRLEQEIAASGGNQEPSDTSPDSGFAAPAADQPGAGFGRELESAARIAGIEMDTLVPAAAAAAQRNLASVTAGRYVRIEVGHEGEPAVHARDDSLVKLSGLSHGTRELVCFCLRTGLVEALAGKLRLPIILDDPLAGFDPGRQQAACQILRTLGAKTQVILFASNPALRSAGDAAAELK